MIQRIQSLYIAIVAALGFMMLSGNIVSFAGTDGTGSDLRFNGLFNSTASTVQKTEGVLPLSVLLITIPVVAFITLFLFRFRKLQLRASVLTLLLLIGEILMIAWYIFYSITRYDLAVIFNIRITFPVVSVILMYLAFRGILKDELLIRSYDRLR